MRTTAQLADYVYGTGYRDIDPAVIERAKDLALSSLGSAVLGARMEVPLLLAEYVKAAGGPAEASVIGLSFRTTAELAAAMNCSASHSTELEDVAWPEATYTCFLIPAVFSLGEKLGASGRAVLEAMVLGYEITARPSMICSDGGATARGWLPASQLGTVGVAAAAAKMMGLSLEQTRNAIAVAASFGGGLNRQTGSGAHVVEAGFAGRNGIMAASLAGRGLTGNPTILEGKAGFWDALAGQPDLDFDLGTGRNFRILAVGMKKYPCCYLTQRLIDGLKALIADHGITADAVESVDVDVNQTFPQIIKYPDPEDGEQARFSLPHILTAVLRGEKMLAETFTTAKVKDPVLIRHRHKVAMTVHPEWGPAQLGEYNILKVRMRDGTVYEKVCRTAHGDAVDPLSREEVIQKFRDRAEGLLPPSRLNRVAGLLADLETVADVSPLMTLLAFPGE